MASAEQPASGRSTAAWLEILVGRIRSGDPDALNQLLLHVEGRLRVLTRRLLQGFPGVQLREQTDDVLQQSLLRLHRSLATVELADLNHFLRLAALQIRRELLSLAERDRNAPLAMPLPGEAPEGSDPGHDDVADVTSGPDDLALWTEFHGLVELLDEPLRAVFDLLYYHELTQEEAGAMLGLSDRTVRDRWRRARLFLMEKMGGRLPGS